jgi:nicotinamide riboside kinase
MIERVEKIYDDGKRSLESLLREKAYNEVKEVLEEKGIDIQNVADEDIETLVSAKVQDSMQAFKGVVVGGAFAFALSYFLGGF